MITHKKEEVEILKLAYEVYKKTIAYELEKHKVCEDGSIEIYHSDAYMDEHQDEDPLIRRICKD